MELISDFIAWAKANGPLGICLIFALYTIKWLMGKMINGFNDALNRSTVAFGRLADLQERSLATMERIDKALRERGIDV